MKRTGSELNQRADLTYKANANVGRHGWLRLTPAYSLTIVQQELANLPNDAVVLEPFSGSGTTPLVAQEMGLHCEAREINPFLVWFGNTKLAFYSKSTRSLFMDAANAIVQAAQHDFNNEYWTPPIFQIDKWWDYPTLQALAALKHYIGDYSGKVRDLLDVTFCRIMIETSNAAFNHQSMSFKNKSRIQTIAPELDYSITLSSFENAAAFISKTLQLPMSNTAWIQEGDSTKPFKGFRPADLVVTSPPYVNRMSYIRELRPYMYWLKFLGSGAEAADLDWQTTGGTWGSASSRLKNWKPSDDTPIDDELNTVCKKISGGKSGNILAPYVNKYFHDMWDHFKAVTSVVKSGGNLCYIVGNSTFSGNIVPTQEWYAEMMKALKYKDVRVNAIRKRNSNKSLFEFAIHATKI